MPSLTELIQSFQRGSLTRDEFLASVDLVLKEDATDSTQFARVLSEEHTRYPLPAAVYAEVMRRIDSHAGAEATRIESTRIEETRIESTRIEAEPSDRSSPSSLPASGSTASNTGS